jgi:5,5'-dehydrodivanillate O-demethylase
VTQGPIADRTAERLGPADRGVTVMRRQLFAELDAIAGNRLPRWSDLGADGRTIDLPRRSSSQPILRDRV